MFDLNFFKLYIKWHTVIPFLIDDYSLIVQKMKSYFIAHVLCMFFAV